MDRIIAGLCTLFIRPDRLLRIAVALRPSTLLAFPASLVKRKYRQLFSPKRRGKPGPKGPSPALIAAIVETNWTAHDLESKLLSFKEFYNDQRCHYTLDGDTTNGSAGNIRPRVADLDSYRWRSHCRGLYQLPVAA
jgi:hypothetical protein